MSRQKSYTLQKTNSPTIFEFISEGPKGSIRKRVEFERTNRADTFNLAFGDVNAKTGDFDDTVITDNSDREKVLATVAETVRIFLNKRPNAYVYATGNSHTRTRLYRIGISNNLEAISNDFDVLGLLPNKEWANFEKNGNYSAFLITKK